MKAISVEPAAQGWMVSSEAIANQLFFRSGACAESAALQLAHGLAHTGAGARIEIYLRDGSLGRRFVVPPLPAPFALKAPGLGASDWTS